MTRSDSLLAQAAIAEELDASPSQPLFEDDDIEDPPFQSHDEPAPVRRAGTWFCARLMSEWTSCFNLFDRELDRQDMKRARRYATPEMLGPVCTNVTHAYSTFVLIPVGLTHVDRKSQRGRASTQATLLPDPHGVHHVAMRVRVHLHVCTSESRSSALLLFHKLPRTRTRPLTPPRERGVAVAGVPHGVLPQLP
jgi:hypothetical protein